MKFGLSGRYGSLAAVLGLGALLALSGCGGGGGSDAAGLGTTAVTPPATTPPVTPPVTPPGGGTVVDNGVPAVATTGTKLISTAAADLATSVATDPAGNVYTVGSTWGGIDNIINDIKFGVWTNADRVSPGYTSDAFLVKYSPSGTIAWTRQFGSIEGDYATGVAVDRLGNVFVVGYTFAAFDNQAHPGGKAAFITKYSTSGTRLWTRIYGSGVEDEATGVSVDSAGRAFVTGRTRANGVALLPGAVAAQLWISAEIDNTDYTGWETAATFDGFVARFDGNGTRQWTTLLGKGYDDSALGVANDELGNTYVTGYVSLDVNFSLDALGRRVYFGPSPVPLAFLAKLDSATGAKTWDAVSGDVADLEKKDDVAAGTGGLTRHLYYQNYLTGVGVDRDGGTYQGGYIHKNHEGNTSNAGDVYFKITRRFRSGNLNWHSYAAGTSAGDQVRGLTVDRGGDVYMVGYAAGNFDGNGHVGGTDLILMQFDGVSGSKIRTLQIGTVTEDKAFGIASDGGGNIYVAGFTYGTFGGSANAGGYDAFALKFNQALQQQ